ncbi:MAG TPA: GntR family transcriptional regulator [Symbiobacteriaceae bacterium]|nr:GntR family transcriptional regulator [Symbiobacteriaceae bacterium]
MGKDVPIPLYYQIKARLLEAIESGQLKPGDRVMSERELTAQFSVSRMTARQALTELENQGYLFRVQGKGTFVATPKLEQPLAGLTSFTEEMRRRGLEPGAKVLAAEEVPAGRRVARALGLGETAAVVRLERLRLAGGEPMALEVSHLPASLVPGLLERTPSQHSLYSLLAEEYGIRPVRGLQSIEAVAANSYEAETLRVREGTPLLMLERITRDAQDRPVEYVYSLYRGDRYRFTTELARREEKE